MRRLATLSLLAALAACNSSGSTAPDASVLRIRLRDDRAASGGRNQVLVTLTSGEQISAQTGTDGNADIQVAGPGTYRVRVVPRAGYVAQPDLTRNVTLAANETAVVDFTLHRVGGNGDVPESTIPNH